MPINNYFIKSPFNYTGGKYKLLPQIMPYFPKKIKTFVDMFCGGGNVGVNITADKVIYNDICSELISLYKVFYELPKPVVFDTINNIIKKYHLSEVYKYGYGHYGCNSSNGLGRYNKENYLKLRAEYNKIDVPKSAEEYLILYVLIVYAFNNQIRFNTKREYNLPVGKRDFNMRLQKNLSEFIDALKSQVLDFSVLDFRQFNIASLGEDDFVYLDPPYLITCAAYNESDGWSESDENDLLNFIDKLDNRNIKFALSNVFTSKGKKNDVLIDWISRNKKRYHAIHLEYNYGNSNYHTKNKINDCDEVLITNCEEVRQNA